MRCAKGESTADGSSPHLSSIDSCEALAAAEREWYARRDADLQDYWPREELPHTYMTHHANFALPKQGYTHWWKMFNATRSCLFMLRY